MPNPQDLTNLRHGLREDSFRRYESVIRDACLSYPDGLKVTCPDNMSELTVVARLRDAIRSLKAFEWPIAWDKTNLEKIVVCHNNDGIIIGPTKTARQAAQQITLSPTIAESLTLTKSEIEAFCLLISNKKLSGPVIFSVSKDPTAPFVDLDYFPSVYDVSIVPHSENTFLLL